MKKLILFGFFLLSLFVPFSVSAHGNLKEPEAFKINNVYTEPYPVPTTSLNNFVLPHSYAVNPYLVNQSLHFELLKDLLPLPEGVTNPTFFWDYGDGQTAEGTVNDHTYTRPGSYILTIKARYTPNSELEKIHSDLINIVPHKDFILPKAVIQVNGQQSKDSLTDILAVNLTKEIIFDATHSQSGDSKIKEYVWDFGDQHSSQEAKVTYTYPQKAHQLFVVLRVITEEGFIADTFTEIQQEDKTTTSTSSPLSRKMLLSGGAIALGLIGLLIWKKFH